MLARWSDFIFFSIYFFCIIIIKFYHIYFISYILKYLKHDFLHDTIFRENLASRFLVSLLITI